MMESLKRYLCILIFYAISKSVWGGTTNAYVYYKNAKCVSGGDIYGTLVLAYDNSRMKGQGFKITRYNGKCKYFQGGYYDFMYDNYSSDKGSFMQNGYCIRCKGVVGCTSTRYSCKGFSTVIPTNAYTMAENSSTSNSTTKATTWDNNMTVTDEDYAYMEEVGEEIYQELSRSQSSPFYTICGALFGSSVMLLGALFRSRSRRRYPSLSIIRRENIEDNLPENVYQAEETI